MELIKIAWRNVWRNKTRSLVVIFAICFGMIGGGFSTALMVGAVNQRIEKAISNESAHLQIHNPGFVENPEMKNIIPDISEVNKNINELDFVVGVSNRLKVNSMIQSAYKNTGVTIVGVNPEKEALVSKLEDRIIDGNYFEDNKKNQIIISKRLADKLNVKMRSKPVLTFQDFSGNITGGAFRITGIFATDSKMFDEMNVFVKRSDLERIAGFTPSSAHEIAVLFKDNDNLKKRTQEIVAVSPDNLEVKNWKDLYPELGMMSLMTEKYLFYLVAIIMFALAFGIINTMMMSILERRKELGMLMAIGMTQRKIRKMIIWETLFLTAVGSFAGLVINQGLVSYFGSKGLDFSAFAEGFSAYGFSAVFYPEINGMFYFQIVGLVVVTALVAAIFPIIRAGKMKPSEILASN